MKNILFFTENFSGENARGGTELATFRIADGLKNSGDFRIFHAFRKKSDGKDKSIYSEVVKLPDSQLAFERYLKEFIIEHRIDAVINMGRLYRHKTIVNAARFSKRKVQVVFMHHFAPGSELKKTLYSSGFHLLKLNPFNPLYWLRSTLYPVLKLPRRLSFQKTYKDIYEDSDNVVLLSKGYENDFCREGGFSDKEKFTAIPNIYERKEGENIGNLFKDKRKHVLILSRMDEIQKRISTALEIWHDIEKDPTLEEWHLDIVGTGHNSDIVKRLMRKLSLKRVTYHGWQSPEEFLKRDSIIMMTSIYEGLPLSLIEAQAYGCVPIAFDTFASLKDVVEDGVTGVIVDKIEIGEFVKRLSSLMKDDAERLKMAENCVSLSDRFTTDKIVEKWSKILT